MRVTLANILCGIIVGLFCGWAVTLAEKAMQ
jgi:hypothetical protein